MRTLRGARRDWIGPSAASIRTEADVVVDEVVGAAGRASRLAAARSHIDCSALGSLRTDLGGPGTRFSSSQAERSAGRVLVVIAYRDLDGDLHGINAWPATGADLKLYKQGDDDGQDD